MSAKTYKSAFSSIKERQAGNLTVSAQCEPFLEKIVEDKGDLKAWSFFDNAYVAEQIRTADADAHIGPLAGIPVAIKDIIDVLGLQTGCGSPIYHGEKAAILKHKSSDASIVSMLRAAGAILMGKTVTTEFATFQAGETKNPRALGRTPGGSSSGSAAAVAAGMVPLALGSQTAGSIIRPASFCGVVGFKPTIGTFDLTGVKALARTFDTLGVFANDVIDASLLIDTLTGNRFMDFCSLSNFPKTIGLCRSPFWDEADPMMNRAWDELIFRLARYEPQVTLIDVELPTLYSKAADVHNRVLSREAVDALHFEWRCYKELIGPKLAGLLHQGEIMDMDIYRNDIDIIVQLRRSFSDAMGGADILLTPSSTGVPPLFEDGTGDPLFNRMWSLLGVPALNVPGLMSSNDLPIGIQVIARHGDDSAALAAGHWLQTVLAES